jgi:hypothetical protein
MYAGGCAGSIAITYVKQDEMSITVLRNITSIFVHKY